MKSFPDSALPLPENVLSVSISKREWNGATLDIAAFRGSGPVVHRLRHGARSRLSVLLEEVGSPCEPRLNRHEPSPFKHTPRQMHFAPAGLEMWGYSANPLSVKDATLTFDPVALADRLEMRVSSEAFSTPRLRLTDARIWTLTKLLSDSIHNPDPTSQLFGDGLTGAIFALLFVPATASKENARGLAPLQLRRVTEHLHAYLPQRIALADLAELAGLSQAHFSRAFKASTGVAPYRWQLERRIQQAQRLLLETPQSLQRVAEATGFADAAHFGRVFRNLVGTTPAAWQRDQKD
jgi:AraC family transcriptional regulator